MMPDFSSSFSGHNFFTHWVKKFQVNQEAETSVAMRVSEALEIREFHGFRWFPNTPIFSDCNKSHSKYKNMEQYTNAVIDRSAKKQFMLDPILAIADTAFRNNLERQDTLACSFSHSHTMDISSDGVYLLIADKLCQIASITISGVMQWSLRTILPEYYVLKNAATHEVFSGAVIADSGEGNGHMFAMIFPPKGRTVNYHNIFLTEKQKQIIHNLKLKDG